MASILIIGVNKYAQALIKEVKHLTANPAITSIKTIQYIKIAYENDTYVNWNHFIHHSYKWDMLLNCDYAFPVPSHVINEYKYGYYQLYPISLGTKFYQYSIVKLLSETKTVKSAEMALIKHWNENPVFSTLVSKSPIFDIATDLANYETIIKDIAAPSAMLLTNLMTSIETANQNQPAFNQIDDQDSFSSFIYCNKITTHQAIRLSELYKKSGVKIMSYISEPQIPVYFTNIAYLKRSDAVNLTSVIEYIGKMVLSDKNGCYIRLLDGWIKAKYKTSKPDQISKIAKLMLSPN